MSNKCDFCGKEVSYWGSNDIQGKICCNECYITEFDDTGKKTVQDIEIQKKINSIVVSSLLSMENKTVNKYFDIIASEVVLGTGMFSEFNAATSDFFGVRSSAFEEKFKKAKEAALKEIKRNAYSVGADAVLGADIDYMEIGKNMLMVTISGTPVIFDKSEE